MLVKWIKENCVWERLSSHVCWWCGLGKRLVCTEYVCLLRSTLGWAANQHTNQITRIALDAERRAHRSSQLDVANHYNAIHPVHVYACRRAIFATQDELCILSLWPWHFAPHGWPWLRLRKRNANDWIIHERFGIHSFPAGILPTLTPKRKQRGRNPQDVLTVPVTVPNFHCIYKM